MTVLEGRAQKIIRDMEQQGKVVTLSRECTENIDHQLAMALKPIKEESRQIQRSSRSDINKRESVTPEV